MKNFISKLTFKKANIITITISLILSALLSIFCFNAISSEKLGLLIFVVVSFALLVYFTMYVIIGLAIFNLPEKEAKEKAIKNFNLTQSEYTEVDYDCTTIKSLIPFLLIVHTKYYFYVKLNENEKLHLLIKTKKQETIYDSTISFTYFNAHFK